jgi:hypothetical protein
MYGKWGVASSRERIPASVARLVGARQLLGRRVLTAYRLLEMPERCRSETGQYPAQVYLIGNAPGLRQSPLDIRPMTSLGAAVSGFCGYAIPGEP